MVDICRTVASARISEDKLTYYVCVCQDIRCRDAARKSFPCTCLWYVSLCRLSSKGENHFSLLAKLETCTNPDQPDITLNRVKLINKVSRKWKILKNNVLKHTLCLKDTLCMSCLRPRPLSGCRYKKRAAEGSFCMLLPASAAASCKTLSMIYSWQSVCWGISEIWARAMRSKWRKWGEWSKR